MKAGVMVVTVDTDSDLESMKQLKSIGFAYTKEGSADDKCYEETFFESHEIVCAVLLNKDGQYIASVKVNGGIAPLKLSSYDVRLLMYPFIHGGGSTTHYVVVAVEHFDMGSSVMNINPQMLSEFLQEKNCANGCGLFEKDELEQGGVIMTDGCNKEERVRLVRGAHELLKVTFADGTVICDKYSAATFVHAIEHMGVEKVAALGIKNCNIPLVSREYSSNKNYKMAQKESKDGWLVFTLGTAFTKQLLLRHIAKLLDVDIQIERGSHLKPLTTTRVKWTKSTKLVLLVTLPGGDVIKERNSRDTYIKALQYIGMDKVIKIDIDIAGLRPVMRTSIDKSRQLEVEPNVYVTIPNGTKRMYKYLRLIASLTKTKMDVAIG